MFMAGANSIFTGDRLLTTSNPEFDSDKVSWCRNLVSHVLLNVMDFALRWLVLSVTCVHVRLHVLLVSSTCSRQCSRRSTNVVANVFVSACSVPNCERHVEEWTAVCLGLAL